MFKSSYIWTCCPCRQAVGERGKPGSAMASAYQSSGSSGYSAIGHGNEVDGCAEERSAQIQLRDDSLKAPSVSPYALHLM